MEYQEFIEEVTLKIEERVEEDCEVKINSVRKNNGIVLQGLSIRNNDKSITSPTIYLNEYYEEYQNGENIDTIVDEIIILNERAQTDVDFDVEGFADFDKMKDRIVYKLINYDKNRELLQDIPHMEYLDLAIVFYCLLSDDSIGNASILIYNSHMKLWNTDTETLYQIATKNSPLLLKSECKDMMEVLFEYCPNEVPNQDSDANMFVLTNSSKFNGAAVILYADVLKNFAERMKKDFYILPSSVHEVILLTAEDDTKESELAKMVKDINESVLQCEEVLSDHVYFYSRKEDSIVLSA